MINLKGFTPAAARVLLAAQICAQSMGLSVESTGHLLYGLAKADPDVSKNILGEYDLRAIEMAVLRCYGRGEVGYARVKDYSHHLFRVLLRVQTYSTTDNRIMAGTVHLWQELLLEDGCHAHEILNALGKDTEALKTALASQYGRIDRPAAATVIPSSDLPVSESERQAVRQSEQANQTKPNIIAQYARDLTQEAREMRLEPMIGRDEEINALIQILGKKTKNNPLLIGEPGVGKTAVVEGLAQHVVMGQVPVAMRQLKIYALDMTRVLAGTRFRGEFEDRLTRIVETAQADSDIILFIDEIHNLIGGGRSEGGMDAGNILKPALARGIMRVIGATTNREYRNYFEKDMALARRFQRIDINEPSRNDTLNILYGLRERYEEFHHVTISDEALTAAVDYSSRYVTDRHLPDKAIDLLDETASMRKLGLGELTAPADIKEQLSGVDHQQGNTVSQLTVRNELTGQQLQDRAVPVIIQDDVARVIATWTGIPLNQILSRGNENLLTLEARMNERIIGQCEAVHAVCAAMRRSVSGLGDPNRPLGAFLLLGTSGVGKTELCRALAEQYFGSEDALIRLDMSEYAEEISMTSLIGSPPGYVGYGDGAKLTDSVLKRPYSVVLFDEIEKAHPRIYNLLLQLLDNGEMTDSSGRRVNFRNTIIMMTSNAGVSFDLDKQMGFGESGAGDVKKQLLNRVRSVFRPEFLGRIDEIVVMNRLTEADGARIAGNMLGMLSERLGNHGLHLEWTPAVLSLIARKGMDKSSGARNIRKTITDLIEDPLSIRILEEPLKKVVRLDAREDEVIMELSEIGDASVPPALPGEGVPETGQMVPAHETQALA